MRRRLLAAAAALPFAARVRAAQATPLVAAASDLKFALAEIAEPGKTSWNLEPWRPVVDDQAMVDAGCNPGGGEEPS